MLHCSTIIIIIIINNIIINIIIIINIMIYIGGGIHGVSTAYYLSQRGIKSLIIEKSAIAAAASGN